MTKPFGCKDVYKEQNLNKIFSKALDTSIRQIMRGYWNTQNKTASLYDLDLHATTLLKLQ